LVIGYWLLVNGYMSHSDHHSEVKGSRLLIATMLNLFISVAEIIGGLLSNSLSLMSDAFHNLSDGLAIFIAWIANKISSRPSNLKRTFGYKRIEIMAAMLNAGVLLVISVWLFYEATWRLFNPEPIKSGLMIIVAIIGLLANFVAVVILRADSKKNINVKAAYLHLFGDTLSSIAVIIGGILIYFFDIYWIDPVITMLIGLYLLKETWGILKQANSILMQGVPAGLNLEIIRKDLEQIGEIANIHHVHLWNLDDHAIHFECHVELKEDFHLSETRQVQSKIESLLEEKYEIGHVTVQFEYQRCEDQSLVIS
jgi:cobalt-zinc-cadmium efflux system protein